MTQCRLVFAYAPAVAFVLGLTPQARAEGASAANALFDEGRRLMEAGKYAQACPKFVDSQKLDPGVGTMLNLAVCYEKNGQTASAWSEYRDAAAAARDKGQLEREQIARAGAARLEPQLFKVVIGVSPQSNSDDITLELDGTPTPKGLWGLPTPVDPGKHRVEAKAPTKKPWSTSFEVTGPSTPAVTVPVLEAAPVSVGADLGSSSASDAAVANPLRDGKGQRTAALVVGGVGVVGVAVGAIFGLMAKPTYNKSAPFCNGNNCTDQGLEYRNSAFAKADIATVGFAIGAAGLVGGAVLWFTAPKKTESGATLSIAPVVARTSSGIIVQAGF
jgi:serine/threonine-protein kinase